MRLSLSQSPRVILMLVQDQPQRPSTSPRSIARLTSGPPGYPETSLSFAPSRLRSMIANMSGSEPGPSPPTVNGVLSMSLQVLTGDVCHVAHRLTWSLPLPSHV